MWRPPTRLQKGKVKGHLHACIHLQGFFAPWPFVFENVLFYFILKLPLFVYLCFHLNLRVDRAQLYGPYAKKMVNTFKTFLKWQGIIECDRMVQDEPLTAEEKQGFFDAVKTTTIADSIKATSAE